MRLSLIFLALVIFSCTVVYAQDSIEYDKRTPFPAVKYFNDYPFVLVENEWVKLNAIAGIDVSEYIQLAVEYNPRNWKKAFHRWMHYMFDEFEIERKDSLTATFFKGPDLITKQFVLRSDNRELATVYHDSIKKIRPSKRINSIEIPSNFEYLTQRIYNVYDSSNWLKRDEAIADLDYLEYELTQNYSYLMLNNYDFHLGIDAIKSALNNGIDKRDFALQLKLFMANFGDGHSTVGFRNLGKFKNLPFRIIEHDSVFYAIDPSTNSFYNADFPSLKSINNVPIVDLFTTVKQLVAKTTDGYVVSSSLSYLRYIELALRMHNLRVDNDVTVEFYNNDSKESVYQTLSIGNFKLKGLTLNHTFYDSIISSQIGYMAFNYKMLREDSFINNLHKSMVKFSHSNSLIIDIRGNGGGSRDALVNLMPYFINEPTVLNVGKFRINYNVNLIPPNGFLERRFMYPITADDVNLNGKSNAFKKCVSSFSKLFKPDIELSDSLFSAYHYMVAYPKKTNAFAYNKPVVVLIDEGCFSASDIFAAGIRQSPNVELVGNTTGGGSGYSDSKKLPFSKLTVRLSRMFSYQPNGLNYDGVGVMPDVEIPKTIFDKMGREDSQLEFAIMYLNKKNH